MMMHGSVMRQLEFVKWNHLTGDQGLDGTLSIRKSVVHKINSAVVLIVQHDGGGRGGGSTVAMDTTLASGARSLLGAL